MSGTPWTPGDLARLEEMIDNGSSYRRIARRFGRTSVAVALKASRRGHTVLHQYHAYSATGIAEVFGFASRVPVLRWIDAGYLPARNISSGGPRWRITYDDVLAFLDDETTWMLWSVAQVNDPDLREYAAEIRTGKPRWLSIVQAAERAAVGITTMKNACRNGFLPALYRLNTYWVREPDVDTFVPKSLQPRPLIPCAVCGALVKERGMWKHQQHSKRHRRELRRLGAGGEV